MVRPSLFLWPSPRADDLLVIRASLAVDNVRANPPSPRPVLLSHLLRLPLPTPRTRHDLCPDARPPPRPTPRLVPRLEDGHGLWAERVPQAVEWGAETQRASLHGLGSVRGRRHPGEDPSGRSLASDVPRRVDSQGATCELRNSQPDGARRGDDEGPHDWRCEAATLWTRRSGRESQTLRQRNGDSDDCRRCRYDVDDHAPDWRDCRHGSEGVHPFHSCDVPRFTNSPRRSTTSPKPAFSSPTPPPVAKDSSPSSPSSSRPTSPSLPAFTSDTESRTTSSASSTIPRRLEESWSTPRRASTRCGTLSRDRWKVSSSTYSPLSPVLESED